MPLMDLFRPPKDPENDGFFKEAQALVEAVTARQLQKFCPIMESSCTKACVHFKDGYVDKAAYREYGVMRAIDPSCRLWR